MNVRVELEAIASRLAGQNYDVRPLVFDPPATEAQVVALEAELGTTLPQSFRTAMLEVSGHVEFRWFTDDVDFPEPYESNFSGDLHWSLDFTKQFDAGRKSWCANVFSNTTDPYDAVWYNKLAFYEVGNGDLITLDLAEETHGQVVYLSHDDGQGHGYVLADDFQDLLTRWIHLACTGGEDWQWLPFTSDRTSRLDPSGPVAAGWRTLLGLDALRDT